jgi:hypothetical protein
MATALADAEGRPPGSTLTTHFDDGGVIGQTGLEKMATVVHECRRVKSNEVAWKFAERLQARNGREMGSLMRSGLRMKERGDKHVQETAKKADKTT